MKNYIYPLAIAATLAATTSCNDEEVSAIQNIPDSQKAQISFSLSDESQSTRAGFLGATTHLVMRIQSDSKTGEATKYTRTVASAAKDASGGLTDYSDVTFNTSDVRYWDDAHGRNSLLSIYAVAVPNGDNTIKNNSSSLEQLIAAGNSSDATKWGNVATNTIVWKVNTTAQTKDASSVTTPQSTIDQEDLVYSNNIQADGPLGKDGVYRWDYTTGKHTPEKTGATTHHDGQMLFFQQAMMDETAASATVTDAPGHFDQGHLVFNHALSRMTITLIKGDGGGDFKFETGTNIKLLGMNTSGTLDVKTGVWSDVATSDIAKIAQTTNNTSTAAETFAAQMLPGYTFTDGDNMNVMRFTIDNNTYFVTRDMLFDALWNNSKDKVTSTENNGLPTYSSGTTPVTSYTMEQGKNYVFKIKIDKAKIQSITATLAKWVDVTAAEFALDNTHITVSTKTVEGDVCDELQLFRLEEELDKIYTDDSYTAKGYRGNYKQYGIATLTPMSTGSHVYQSNWYYKDNKTAYHLRTLNKLAASGTTTGTDHANVLNTTDPYSYFKIESGDQTTHDYHWGAPMIESATLKYNKAAGPDQGYSSNLHKGFVSPDNKESNAIHITEFHMMSNIYIRLVTDSIVDPEDADKYILGPDAVELKDATITLTRFAKTGQVDMGTGFVSPHYVAATTHDLVNGDAEDCAKIIAPSFTDGYWVRAEAINASTDWYKYAVVPQALHRSTPAEEKDCVGITIRTTDNNEYYVIKDLASIKATSVTDTRDQAKDTAIERWFPGHRYYYTIRITKKGIAAITCTVAKWVDVVAEQIDIDLEN